MLWVFTNGPVDMGSIPGESYQRLKKWYLIPPCLTLSIIRYGSRVKWSNQGKGIAPPPIPQCSSYWKGSLHVTLGYGRQLYFSYETKKISHVIVLIFLGFKGISTIMGYSMSSHSTHGGGGGFYTHPKILVQKLTGVWAHNCNVADKYVSYYGMETLHSSYVLYSNLIFLNLSHPPLQ